MDQGAPFGRLQTNARHLHLTREYHDNYANSDGLRGRRYVADGYCCLGVACKLAGAADDGIDDKATSILPLSHLYDDLKLTEGDCDFLAARNDGGETFAEIADRLETGNFPSGGNFKG